MKLKQFRMTRETSGAATRTHNNNGEARNRSRNSATKTCVELMNDKLCHLSESFRGLDMDGFPENSSSADEKLSWVQSQMVGNDAVFDSPFGKRRLTYADHTASGRSLRYIEDYIIDNVLPFYANTHTCDSYVGIQTTKMVHEASHYIKQCMGGGEEDALLFCGSGSTAAVKRLQEVMGISVPSILREKLIKCLTDEERWVVFVGPYEHHSNLLSWRQSLAEVVEIGLDEDGLINMEALRFQLELYKAANRPILGSFSACSNVTGIYSDTRSIARLLHQYGGFACFDFAASGPYVEMEMRSGEMDGYDVIFLSPHKFLGGPGSPGILLMSKALYVLGSSAPSTCGGGTVNYVNGFNEKDTLYYEKIEERENGGTPQIIQIIRAALAFWVKHSIGCEVIKVQEEIYIERAIERLLPNQNMQVLGSTNAKRLAILSFLVYSTTNSSSGNVQIDKNKPLHGAFVAKLLNDLFGIQARGGCACAGPYGHSLLGFDQAASHKIRSAIQKGYTGVKPGWTRVSFPYYMSNEEFEFILAALEFVGAYGQRFLPLYHFNLKTGTWCFRKAIKYLMGRENNAGDLQEKKVAQEHNSADIKHLLRIEKFTSYLESAKQIARFLPKFPSERSLPKDVDPNILYFRI